MKINYWTFRGNMINLLPLFIPENIKADFPRGGDVRMEDPGEELNSWSFQRVLVRECHLQLEGSILNTKHFQEIFS